MINLDPDLLRTFLAISRHGTFSQAAELTFKTQSAVTQQMQRLESLVDQPLFEKHGRTKQLSRQGEVLLRYARQIVALNDEAVRVMGNQQLEGVVRIGSPHDVADSILPTVLTHVAHGLPRIKLEIRVDRSPFLMNALYNGDVDLIISSRFDPKLEGRIIRRSPTVWICAANFVLKRGQPIPLVLADEPSIFRRIALNALEQAQIAWQTNYVAPNLVGIKAALNAGLGITARSIELLSYEYRVLGHKDHLPSLPDVTYFLWMRENVVDPITRQVYELLIQEMDLQKITNVSLSDDSDNSPAV